VVGVRTTSRCPAPISARYQDRRFDAATIVLDFDTPAANTILDSFFQADTDIGQPAGPITLSGFGIRSLEWFETDGLFAGLDNIEIAQTTIPEPSSLTLLGLGVLGLARRIQRKPPSNRASKEPKV
jgi:hypothetical protein